MRTQIGTSNHGLTPEKLPDYFDRFPSIEVTLTGATDSALLATLIETVPTDGSISVIAPAGALLGDSNEAFYGLIEPLEDRLGAVLHRIPEDFPYSPTKLAGHLDRLPEGYRHVIQFERSDWYKERTRNFLEERNLAFCLHDLAGRVAPEWITGDFLYVRYTAERYTSDEIYALAGRIDGHLSRGRAVYAYFLGRVHHNAAENARQFALRLDQP